MPTSSILDVDTVNVCQDIELMVDLDHFCTSCQISTINKNLGSKTPLNPKTPFKWVSMYIITYLFSDSLIKYTAFYNYLLVVDAYSKLPRLYEMEKSILRKSWSS